MAQSVTPAYAIDPADPRAPTSQQWARMTPGEQDQVVDMLPTSVPLELNPPEGDVHRKAKQGALSALDDFFRRANRRIYLSSELIVFYPGERSFVPDLLAVVDVPTHDRTRWVVDKEGKGLDFVLEVHVAGDRHKDLELNVERFAHLGVREHYVFDRTTMRLHGYRLPPATEVGSSRPHGYQRIVPQAGHYPSAVLGLDLVVDGDRLRFFAGNAPLEDADEMIARLGAMLDKVIAREESALRQVEEERRQVEEERRKAEEERRRADEAERLLAEARAEIERLTRT